MTPDELEKRGKAFFDKLHVDDKAALKWFLTGQIQNILANEHGIGGSKDVSYQVRARADERINQLLKDDQFLENLAQRLADKHGSRTNYPKMVLDATEKGVREALSKSIGHAAQRVKIKVFIEPDPLETSGEPENFAKF